MLIGDILHKKSVLVKAVIMFSESGKESEYETLYFSLIIVTKKYQSRSIYHLNVLKKGDIIWGVSAVELYTMFN